jgi:hypothetical protein
MKGFCNKCQTVMILNAESADAYNKKGGGKSYIISGHCAFCKTKIAKFGSEEEYKEFNGGENSG